MFNFKHPTGDKDQQEGKGTKEVGYQNNSTHLPIPLTTKIRKNRVTSNYEGSKTTLAKYPPHKISFQFLSYFRERSNFI